MRIGAGQFLDVRDVAVALRLLLERAGYRPAFRALPSARLYLGLQDGSVALWAGAAKPELAKPLYESFCALLAASGLRVATGEFGAHMDVELVNDGPVTIVVESPSSP